VSDELVSKSQAIEALEKRRDRVPADLKNYAMNEAIRILAALPVVSSPVTLTRETLDELRYQVAVSHESPEGMNPWDAMGALIDAILEPSAPPVGTQE
jgi:hypothetical protein